MVEDFLSAKCNREDGRTEKEIFKGSFYPVAEEMEELFDELEKIDFLYNLGGVEISDRVKANILKEMCDVVFSIRGYCIEHGWDFDEAFRRVYNSNMTKDGTAKGPSYKEPCLTSLVRR
jgi:NTP pyrophosphatase (non-canonical NTP hydrolase)